MRSRGSCAFISTVVVVSVLAAGGTPRSPAPAESSVAQRFVAAADPAWSPDGQRIAFVEQRVDPASPYRPPLGTLYVINVDGTGARRVIAREFDASSPSWSPDGRRIVFEHQSPKSGDSASTEVDIVNTDGSGLRTLVSPGTDPAWGPGGKRIAFSMIGFRSRERIHTVSPDGSDLRLVADSRDRCEVLIQPTWSPDGEFVAFTGTGGTGECSYSVFIAISRGFGARYKVILRDWAEEPAWSPDGKKLAFTRNAPVESKRPVEVGILDLRTRKTEYLRPGWSASWSPDGKQLVFVGGNPLSPQLRSQLYVMDADGSHVRQLTR